MLDIIQTPGAPTLNEIRDRMVRLKDLLVAADQLGNAFLTTDSGPVFAVMQVALQEARRLDDMVDELCEAAAASRD